MTMMRKEQTSSIIVSTTTTTPKPTPTNQHTMRTSNNYTSPPPIKYMKAVRCRRFASIEVVENKDDNGQRTAVDNKSKNDKKTIVFQPRKSPLRLRDCLSLDTVGMPLSQPCDSNRDDTMVLIKTMYAGIQYPDALQARGLYQVRPPLPYVPGMDVVGVVVHASKTSTFEIGTYVYACLTTNGGTGGLAQYVTVPSGQVCKLPADLTMSHHTLAGCANIGRNYFAAYHSLVTIGCRRDKTDPTPTVVLVTGASGGVGMATIEIAKALKWNVIAGVSTHGKVDAPKAVGADVVLVYGKTRADRQLFKSQVQDACRILRGRGDHSNRVGTTDGVDLVVDMVQGDLFEQALVSVVRPLGTIALVGFAAGQRPIRPGLLLVKEINVVGSLWGRFAVEHPEQHRRNVHHILQMLASGQIKPRVDTIVPLENFIDAFEIFETNRGRGNTVVSFMDDDGAAAAAEVMRSRL